MNKLQSEYGLTGESSPNLEFMEEIQKKIKQFDHVHKTITEYDCVVCISNVYAGNKIDGTPHYMTQGYINGCNDDIAEMIYKVLIDNDIHFVTSILRKTLEAFKHVALRDGYDVNQF